VLESTRDKHDKLNLKICESDANNRNSARFFNKTMDVRVIILQQNMQGASAVTEKVQNLVSAKHLDVLLLQEPYTTYQTRDGQSKHTLRGIGRGNREMMKRCINKIHMVPRAAIVITNLDFQATFIPQLSTAHCASAEIRASSFSFYAVSCYFQFADSISVKHLSQLEQVLGLLRGKRIIIGVDANAESPL
jgi:hypothetical protein